MEKILTLAALGLVLILSAGAGAPRSTPSRSALPPQASSLAQEADRAAAVEALFRKVEEAISGGDVGRLSQDLARQTYVSVRGKESGYFSSNQAILIVRNYFSSRRLTSFRLSKKESGGTMPFATGGGTFMARGTLESFQVYVALTRIESRWVIAQFNVY